MNILINTFSGNYIVRADTTWAKDCDDLYLPEYVTDLSFSPVLFCKIIKAGKRIRKDFVSRYFDSINLGLLFYPENLLNNSPESFAFANCIDNFSYLPSPLLPISELLSSHTMSDKKATGSVEDKHLDFCILKNQNEILFKKSFSIETQLLNPLEEAITTASQYLSFRIGDIVAVELEKRLLLLSKEYNEEKESIPITTKCCDKESMRFRIVK